MKPERKDHRQAGTPAALHPAAFLLRYTGGTQFLLRRDHNGKLDNLALYGVWVAQWSARYDDNFSGFKTEVSGEGDIDSISVLGLNYRVYLDYTHHF